jgi:AraC-like DNA-binding protein
VQSAGTLIRIEDEPPRARLDRFRAALADTIAPFSVTVEAGPDLRAQVLNGRVGAVELTKVTAPPMQASRTSNHIRVSDPDEIKVDVQVRGNSVFAQDTREAALAPGDVTFMDLSRPIQMSGRNDEQEIIAIRFPRSAVALRQSELDRLTAVSISGRDGLGAPISALARHMARSLEGETQSEGVRLSAALLDLLVVALAERLDRIEALAPATRRRALLAGVQSFIEQRLSDPKLSPSTIAAANHISIRYLHKLFEAQELTVAGWIRRRRLEQCRRDLMNPAMSDWSASAIAARWGIGNASQFSRQFRDVYGVPPALYRRDVGRSGTDSLTGLLHA